MKPSSPLLLDCWAPAAEEINALLSTSVVNGEKYSVTLKQMVLLIGL